MGRIKHRKIISTFFKIKPSSSDSYLKDLKLLVAEHCKQRKVDKNLNFKISLIFFFKNEPVRIHINSLSKRVIDSFSGIIYSDNTQVFKLIAEKKCNQLFEGVSVEISKNI